MALLAIVAAAGPHGVTREKVLGILWPEAEEEQARHTLSQHLYLLRREAGREWVTGSSSLRLAPSLSSDVGEFLQALNAGRLEDAAFRYRGPFLDGFYLPGAPDFERWVDEVRARMQSAALKALETLTQRAVADHGISDAIAWSQRLVEIDPFSAIYAAAHIRALMSGGDRAAALRFARHYEARVHRELETEPDPVIRELAVALSSPSRGTESPSAPRVGGSAETNPEGTRVPARGPEAARSKSHHGMTAVVLAAVTVAALAWRVGSARQDPKAPPPSLAIASIRSPDALATGLVLQDMLATNLARIEGIQVVSNSRLMELLGPASSAGPAPTAEAARRAGASEIVEGEVGVTSGGLVLTLRRVALGSGLVLRGYVVRATDPYALTDSATAAIARDLGLEPPPDAVATVRTRSAIAYALYEEGLRALYGGDPAGALRLMNAALERDSTFAMAAYFGLVSANTIDRYEEAERLLPLVRRLAPRATPRERLLIQASLSREDAPVAEFLGIARELTQRYPADPDAQIALGFALWAAGNWAGSVAAFDRSVVIDSQAGAIAGSYCRVCTAISAMRDSYLWWDSAAGAERAARRLISFRPQESAAWGAIVEPLLRQGRRAEAEAAVARAMRLTAVKLDLRPQLDRDLIRSGRSDQVEALLVSELRNAPAQAPGEMPWLLALSLRNQGRLREAERLAAEGVVPGSSARIDGYRDEVSLAIIALEAGRPREAARRFLAMVASDRTAKRGVGFTSRVIAWHMTLAGTALAAAGDTAMVRALADSVERIGSRSSFGRDYRLHHFLRALLLQREDRHAEAVEEFRRSLFSLTEGYTRTNLLMARSLMALGRDSEAIVVLQPALRGGVDGSNTYVTHTELREALAEAFERTGQRDSAAIYFAAVEHAWRHADPEFGERYRTAKRNAAATFQLQSWQTVDAH